MKKKLGPLPLWAWVLIAGGTIGLVLYMRSGSSTPKTAPVDPSLLDPTAGTPPDANAGGGGGTTSTPTLPDPPTTTATGASNDDIFNALLGLEGDVAALSGGQGLTDQAAGQDGSPVQTFAGEVTDLAAGVTALNKLAGMFTPKTTTSTTGKGKAKPTKHTAAQMRANDPAMVKRVEAKAKKKKTAGSGGLGKLTADKPARRTTQQTASSKTQKRAATHQPAKAVKVSAGGNKQPQRTAKPKKHK